MENSKSKNLMLREVLFWSCFFLYTSLSFYLFYRQATDYGDGRFLSDMPSYIGGVLGTNERDPYPYRLFFWVAGAIHAVFPIQLSLALATTLFNSINALILRHYIDKYLLPVEGRFTLTTRKGKTVEYAAVVSVFTVFSCLLASMIILPFDFLYKFPGQYYIGQGSGNPWHNATYLATRPFSTLSFFLFIELLEDLKAKTDAKKLLLFASALFLCVFAKPTFAVVMMPAAAIAIVAQLFAARFKTFKNSVFLSLAFLPAAADMFRQYFPVFNTEKESGIGIGFGEVWKQYTNSIIFSVALCFAFAICVLSIALKQGTHKTMVNFSWVLLLVSLFEGIFLYEKGPRMADGNFLQGYLHAMFYLFSVSAIVWLSRDSLPKRKHIYDIVAGILFAAHTVSGVWYFVRLLAGHKFY